MKTIVQVNIYRVRGDTPEYLLLLRNDGGMPFWQPVSMEVSGSLSVHAALQEAMQTQAGISSHKRLSQPIYTYEWYAHGEKGRDIVFAAEVDVETEAAVDGTEFTELAWLPFDKAMQTLKWNGNKEALRILHAAVSTEVEQMLRERAAAAEAAERQEAARRQAAEAEAAEAARRAKIAAEIREAVTTPIPAMYQPRAARRGPAPMPLQRPKSDRPPVVIPLPVYAGPDATPPPDISNLPIAQAPAFRRLPLQPQAPAPPRYQGPQGPYRPQHPPQPTQS